MKNMMKSLKLFARMFFNKIKKILPQEKTELIGNASSDQRRFFRLGTLFLLRTLFLEGRLASITNGASAEIELPSPASGPSTICWGGCGELCEGRDGYCGRCTSVEGG